MNSEMKAHDSKSRCRRCIGSSSTLEQQSIILDLPAETKIGKSARYLTLIDIGSMGVGRDDRK
jgi:hypothetical protein